MSFKSVFNPSVGLSPQTASRNRIVAAIGALALVIALVKGFGGGTSPETETKVVSLVQTSSGQDIVYATVSGSLVISSGAAILGPQSKPKLKLASNGNITTSGSVTVRPGSGSGKVKLDGPSGSCQIFKTKGGAYNYIELNGGVLTTGTGTATSC